MQKTNQGKNVSTGKERRRQLIADLQPAKRIVQSWPEWKQNMLGVLPNCSNSSTPSNMKPRNG